MSTDRENADWLSNLRSDGPSRDAALAELRMVLLAGLRSALSGRPGADDAMLEDAVQESLLKVLASLDSFAGRSRFTTWAMSIAVRVAITELRRRRWRDVSLESFADDARPEAWHPSDAEPGPSQRLAHAEAVSVLRRLIATELTDRQRLAITAELAGVPQEEIGRRLGSNRNAVYKLVFDARRRLRAALAAAGVEPDALDFTHRDWRPN